MRWPKYRIDCMHVVRIRNHSVGHACNHLAQGAKENLRPTIILNYEVHIAHEDLHAKTDSIDVRLCTEQYQLRRPMQHRRNENYY